MPHTTTPAAALPAIQVGVVMGSSSDWDTMQHAVDVLKQFGIAHEARVVSAHRMPDDLFAYAESAGPRGLTAIIAGAGGAAHLPGVLASWCDLPVIGVPLATSELKGVDALYSMCQMPSGVPVATVGIGGARNAALLAARILALKHDRVRRAVEEYRQKLGG